MPHSGGPVTVHDVSRGAGVAVSTVSRALSNPDRASERRWSPTSSAPTAGPPRTTVTSPEQAGRALVDLLPRRSTDARVVLPTDLRVRDSTGPRP
jgi:DNA-binding LacI/PurR family transcriptional regulator